MVGPLAHLLKNRFYVGEVAYRGEIHRGDHEPILDSELFDAVQARLAEGKVRRKNARAGSSAAILSGLIFDDRGHPMSPSHSNKKGVRYRYYVSQALLQGRKAEAGKVARVAAPEVERKVCDALRKAHSISEEICDHDLVRDNLERAVVRMNEIALTLRARDSKVDQELDLTIPFAQTLPPRKGIAFAPAENPEFIDSAMRDSLLNAIARSRGWMEAILTGAQTSIDEIALAEGLVERHVRFLLPLAFVSPRVIGAIVEGTVRPDLTVTVLARKLPHRWIDQERLLGIL